MAERSRTNPETAGEWESALRALTRRYGGAGPAAGDPPGPECLQPETVAALVEGAVSPRERERLEAHLANCDRCAAEVGLALSAAGPSGAAQGGLAARGLLLRRLRWVRLAAVAVIAVPFAILAWRWEADTRFQRQLEGALAKAQRVAAIYHLSPYKRATLTPEVARVRVERRRGAPEELSPAVRQAGERAAQEAEEAFAAVRPAGRHRPALLLARAELEAERGQYAKALTLVDEALNATAAPRRGRALMLRATILLDRAAASDEEEGVRILDDLIRQMESGHVQLDPDVYYNRAMVDHQQGRPGPATRSLWERYLQHEPDPAWRQVVEPHLEEIKGRD